MFSAIRTNTLASVSRRAFSTSSTRADMAKVTLIGRLGKEPEVKRTRNDVEFVSYTVATNGFQPKEGPDGVRPDPPTYWHRVLSFNPGANAFLKTLEKGTKVYVEAMYEPKEPMKDADPSTPQGQRQIFLKHEKIEVIERKNQVAEGSENETNETTF